MKRVAQKGDLGALRIADQQHRIATAGQRVHLDVLRFGVDGEVLWHGKAAIAASHPHTDQAAPLGLVGIAALCRCQNKTSNQWFWWFDL